MSRWKGLVLNGCVRFFNFGDNSRLDREGFAPVGEVVRGMEVIRRPLHATVGDEAQALSSPLR